MKRIFTLFVLALFLGTGSVWADADLTISNVTEWKAFCSNVNSGTETYSGKTVVLDADIVMEASGYQAQSVGNETNSFQGTFDGQGHTISYDFTTLSKVPYIAPFRYIKSATIKNVKVAGRLTVTDNNFLGGIVGYVGGVSTSDISYIDNCMSSITLTNSASSGDGRIGGIVAYQLATSGLQITNCLVEGTINGRGQAAGVMGYKKNGASLSVSNILLTSEITGKVNTFVKSEGGEQTISACYTTIASPDQGIYVGSEELASGEVAYNLQASQTTQYWGQSNLNKSIASTVPELTSDDSKKVIKLTMTNGSAAEYANKGGAMPSPVDKKALSFNNGSGGDPYTSRDADAEVSRCFNKFSLVVTSAGATTLVLPVAVETLPEGVKAYKLTYTGGDKVTASEVTSITANEPVLINAEPGNYVFVSKNNSEITYDTENAKQNGALYGVYTDTYKYVPANSYVLQNGAEGLGFYKVAAENTIKITSFRAYLIPQVAGTRSYIGLDDGTTGIQNSVKVENKDLGDDVIYNLSGQVVTNPGKGIYIKNGKKFIIK